MSCRVLGLDVEQRMVAQIVSDLVTGGAEFVQRELSQTRLISFALMSIGVVDLSRQATFGFIRLGG